VAKRSGWAGSEQEKDIIMFKARTAVVATAVAGAILSCTALAQQPIYYPAKGQTPQKQNTDTGECQVWAQQNTGINPAAVAQTPPPPAPSGPAVGGGERLKGAARGAVIGEVAGGERTGDAAAVGAVAGGARARQNQKAQQAAQSSQISTYNRAVAACMEGRGYSVK
jgi:hypothetical protein